jgi:sulfide dehydrogenase [flavocytochrome c] flavoprotein subunit
MLTMESTVHKDIYVVGDSTVHGELPVYGAPKSAHMANTQAKVAVGAIIAKLNGVAAPEPFFVNTCYSTWPLTTGASRWCTSTGPGTAS